MSASSYVAVDMYRPHRESGRVAFMDPAPWMDQGACHGCEDPDVFFPENDATVSHAAKRICAGCPVINQCALYAIERPHLAGIWGGLTGAERTRRRRRLPS